MIAMRSYIILVSKGALSDLMVSHNMCPAFTDQRVVISMLTRYSDD